MNNVVRISSHDEINSESPLVRNSIEFTKSALYGLYEELREGKDVSGAMTHVCNSMDTIRNSLSAPEWKKIVKEEILTHPIEDLVKEDPYFGRAMQKPRGYAGDGIMMDFAYKHESISDLVENSSSMGKKLYEWSSNCTASRAIRARAHIIASYIDKISDEVNRAEVLSVACGHMREALFSRAIREGSIGRLVGLDSDKQSLEEAKKYLSEYGFEGWHRSFTYLIHGKKWYKKMLLPLFISNPPEDEKFDLIYSAGLYDYLPDKIANILTRALFHRLKPDGRLVIANVTPALKERGIAEGLLDWWMFYRNSAGIAEFMKGVDSSLIAEKEIFFDETGDVVFLSVKRV